MQGEKGLEPGAQGSRARRLGATTLTRWAALSHYTHTQDIHHMCVHLCTHIGKTICRQDDSRARKDTTVDRLRQVSNNTI